jgi:predicted Zn-dependent protease
MGRAAWRLGHGACAERLWAQAGVLGIPASSIAAERADAMADRAQRLVGLGRAQDAIAACHVLGREAPDAAVPIGRSAHVLLAAGAPTDAEVVFRRALAQRSEAGDLHVGLSLALANQGRMAEALAAARTGHAARPRDAEVATHYAHMLAGAGRQNLAEAERIFRGVLDRQPGAGLALFGLSRVLGGRGQRNEALLFAQRAVARLPGHHDSLDWLARLVLQGGEATRAEQLFRRLQVEWPARPEPYLGLAAALLAQDRRSEAIGALRRGLTAVPGDAALEARLRRLTRRPTPLSRLVTRLRGFFGRPPPR